VNPAGDEGHVLVTTTDGFRVLDAAGGQLTDDTFPAADPGHAVGQCVWVEYRDIASTVGEQDGVLAVRDGMAGVGSREGVIG
ncbi:hypothetical protein C6A85_11445, partial [Mycobacterium sp. ITM-2017-0098]